MTTKLIHQKFSITLIALTTCLSVQACTGTQANSSHTAPETLAQSPAQSPGNESSYSLTETPCVLPLRNEVEGETVTCGYLTVPENYDAPDGRQVKISFARFHSNSLSPQRDPVIALHGGPGGSDMFDLEGRSLVFDQLRQTRDVIIFDQRGAKYSTRLGCSPTIYAWNVLLEDAEAGPQLEQILAEAEDDDPLTEAESEVVFGLCAALLESHGFNLSQFNSVNSAQDVINLANALGYDQLNLYGMSYGTYLAQQIMRDYPERVRSVVLDSTVPIHASKYEDIVQHYETVMLNLLEDCQQDAECHAAYPNLKAQTIAVLEKLESTPIPLSVAGAESEGAPTQITLESFIENLFSHGLNTNLLVAQYVPLIVYELEQGITTTYEGVVSGKLLQSQPQETVPVGSPTDFLIRARDLQRQADKLRLAEALRAQEQRPSTQWIRQVEPLINELSEPELSRAKGRFLGVGYQTDQPRNRATLLDFVAEQFPGETGAPLSSALNAMDEAEILHVYQMIGEVMDAELPAEAAATLGSHNSVDCREQIPFLDLERATDIYNAMEIKPLGLPKYALTRQTIAK